MVDHYDDLSSGFEHTIDLFDGLFRIRRVMDHAPAIHEVKRIFFKWECFRIGLPNISLKTVHLQPCICELNGFRSKVNAINIRSCPGKLNKICPCPASDLQDFFPSPSGKLGESMDERFCFKTISFDLFKIFQASLLKCQTLCPGRAFIPEFFHLCFNLIRHDSDSPPYLTINAESFLLT